MKNFKLFTINKFNLALVIAVILSLVTSQFTAFAADCNVIRNNTLRLHILANSNSSQDQQLKLMVRDKILEASGELFSATNDIDAAKRQATENSDKIKAIAQDVITENGYDYNVEVTICNDYFNTREYDSFTLPAGNYDAVRVTIGEASGKNWWCVLYPTLCIPAAGNAKENQLEELTDEQRDIIENSGKYEIKFASVELFQKIKNFFQNKK